MFAVGTHSSVRCGPFDEAGSAGGTITEGLRGDRHDAESSVRLSQTSIRVTYHHYPSDDRHLSSQTFEFEQPNQTTNSGVWEA